MFAAQNDAVNNVRSLLQHGADETKKDCRGRTALDWAKLNKNEATIKLLSSVGFLVFNF